MPSATEYYDVVIVGGGIAGCSAAAFLPSMKSVVLLEKTQELGGILRGASNSAGTWMPRSMEDMRDLNKQALAWNLPCDAFTEDELEKMLADHKASFAKLEGMEAIDGMQLLANAMGSYYGEKPSLTFSHKPKRSLLDRIFLRVVMFLMRHCLGIVGRNASSILPLSNEDGLLNIPSHIRRIGQYVRTLSNVDVLFGAEVTSLEAVSEGAARWLVTTNTGTKFGARHVIFASGGFTANRDFMVKRGLGDMVSHHYNDINSGIMEQVSESLKLKRGQNAATDLSVWYCEAITLKSGKRQAVLFLNGDSILVVSPNTGRRVYNEKWEYARRGKVCREHGSLVLIADGKCLRNCSLAIVRGAENVFLPPTKDADYIHAKSPQELATKLQEQNFVAESKADLFQTQFVKQIEKYNSDAREGVDPDFQRHSRKAFVEAAGVPLMSPLDTTDLYAIRLIPSALDTCCGPALNEHSQVLYEENGAAVPGLYATGNASASITQGFYLAPGIPTFSAIVNSYRASNHIGDDAHDGLALPI